MKKKAASAEDELVQKLITLAQQKKAEIAKVEKPVWRTNCSITYSGLTNVTVNLQVLTDVETLIAILGFLFEKEKAYNQASTVLGVDSTFRWMGFTLQEWQSDIKLRIAKIQVSSKKKELEAIEERLGKLISPELRRQMELTELSKLLDD